MHSDTAYILWPVYFDRRASRKQGRRINRGQAVANPRLDEIHRAAKKLGYNPEKQDNKAYPGRWWRNEGLVSIKSEQSKTDILHAVAEQLVKNREN